MQEREGWDEPTEELEACAGGAEESDGVEAFGRGRGDMVWDLGGAFFLIGGGTLWESTPAAVSGWVAWYNGKCEREAGRVALGVGGATEVDGARAELLGGDTWPPRMSSVPPSTSSIAIRRLRGLKKEKNMMFSVICKTRAGTVLAERKIFAR